MKLARIIAGCVLLAVAICGLPSMPAPQADPALETPDEAMRTVTNDVARILRVASPVDRALWAQVWSKVAITASGDADSNVEVVFSDTRGLRAFQIIALNIAWRRLAGNAAGKYAGLGEACEKAFNDTLGKDVQAVTPAVRAKFVALANALAWCGINRG